MAALVQEIREIVEDLMERVGTTEDKALMDLKEVGEKFKVRDANEQGKPDLAGNMFSVSRGLFLGVPKGGREGFSSTVDQLCYIVFFRLLLSVSYFGFSKNCTLYFNNFYTRKVHLVFEVPVLHTLPR